LPRSGGSTLLSGAGSVRRRHGGAQRRTSEGDSGGRTRTRPRDSHSRLSRIEVDGCGCAEAMTTSDSRFDGIEGGRPGSNRHLGIHGPGCCRYTTATMSGDDRTRTGGLSPDKRALCSVELRPQRRTAEGGIGSPQPETETLPSDRLRSQLLPISTSANACPRRHLLTGWPRRLSEASCTLGPALCTSPCSVTPLARPSTSQS
jgi:hypothetical protein